MKNEIQRFISKIEEKVAPLEEQLCNSHWKLATTGDSSIQDEIVRLELHLHEAFSNQSEFIQLKEWKNTPQNDPLLERNLKLLYLAFLAKQEPKELAQKRAQLDVKISSHFANFRSSFGNQEYTVNDIKEILQTSTDNELRKNVWEASKQIGPVVSNLILERVKLCNQIAKSLGFRDYYAFQMEVQEIAEDELYSVLDQLEKETREPFEKEKAHLDASFIKRYGLKNAADLRPWHYWDPFFQDAPSLSDLTMDKFYAGKNLEKLTIDSFDPLNVEIRSILQMSDLYERHGKSQHAFCLMIGRSPEKVRILCNCRDNHYWMGVMLHEFGHGIYFKGLNHSQPYFLRDVAHISTTEAIAMLFGRMTHSPSWIKKVLGLQEKEVNDIAPLSQRELSWHMLVFTRWVLVMAHFERQLYANPDQDLNTLWWDLVEKYQMLHRPPMRDQPDWATKTHIAENPVYYHNYILGEMTASQIQSYIENKLGKKPLIDQPKVGPWLEEKLFSQGALRPWNETLEYLTGEKLNPNYFARQFIHNGKKHEKNFSWN